MTTLISKVQYKNFETGEFVDVQTRNYEEVIELIEQFPWEIQREKIAIDLTNPAVTIEGKNFDYLKFSLFYNQKYILRYFDDTETLYTKSFINLEDGYEYIKNFFEQPVFDTTDFKKEITWFQKNLKHFVTQDFRYVLTPKLIRKYLWSTSGINFCFSILCLFFILFRGINADMLIALLLMIFFVGGGLHLFAFFNYYKHVKDKVLIMSKGNDVFYFGNIDNPVKYNKKDISQYITTRGRYRKNQFSSFAIVEIQLRDGTIIKIPNLLVDYSAIEEKLYEYQRVDENCAMFPLP